MKKVFTKKYGNPGGLYQLGVITKACIKESRNTVAQLINGQPAQIIFTRGGTESNNLALLGSIQKFQTQFPSIIPHVITSTIEHDSVLATLRHLESTNQIQVTYVACNTEGIVTVDDIKKSLRPETMLVSIMYANNEIGTIQPIKEIAKLLRWWKKHNLSMFSSSPSTAFDNRATDMQVYPLLHADAIQAANYCDINVLRLGVDMMTLSGSKIYGPKSSGILFIKNKDWLNPILFGGGQEFGLRSGTEDVAQVVGFAKALEIAENKKDQEVVRLTTLRDFLIQQLLADDRIRLNGSPTDRLPNNINITVTGYSQNR